MSEPVAYLRTWTTYESWIPGDARGSVDREHNVPGAETLPLSAVRAGLERPRQRGATIRLAARARELVGRVIIEHCRIRGWTLHAFSVRPQHVHAVISCPVHPDEARNQLKAWSTRRLRERGCCAAQAQVWTEGGSDRWLRDAEALRPAIVYAGEQQGEG